MKVPKSAFYISLLISTILAVIIFAGIPFVIAGLIIVLFNLSNMWIGPLMVAIYIFMQEWSELKGVLIANGITTDEEDGGDE